MILRILFFGVCFFILQACQTSSQQEVDNKSKTKQAAGYNVQLGLGYLKQGNIARAKRKLLLAMEQSPNSPEVNAAMGYFREKTGDIANAKMYYLKAMNAAPGRGTQLNNYGAFLCRQGQYTQAETYFMKAVEDLQYEHTAGAYENAGLCALAIPNYEKAAIFFGKAIQQDRSRQQSLYELLKINIKLNHLDEALKLIQTYHEQIVNSRDLLKVAIKVTHQLGNSELEDKYRRLMSEAE